MQAEAVVRTWSLRGAVMSIFAIVGAVVLAATVALTAMTAVLERQTDEVAVASARIRASLRTKAALLWYSRQSDLADLDPTPEALAEQAKAEGELLVAVDQTRHLATPDRVVQLDNLVRKNAAYVALRRSLQQRGLPLEDILERATPDLEAVFTDLQQLVRTDDAWATSVEASARRVQTAANVVGALACAAVLCGLAFAALRSARLVQRPILALSDAIGRFGGGERACRAKPEGVREVRAIAGTFNDLAEHLVRQEQERYAFLAGVAHDLRNPLTPLKLAASILAGGQATSEETRASTVAVVKRQVERLDRMVGDLLDAARIEAGQLELHPETVDLRDLAHASSDLYRAASAMHEIDVFAPDAPVLATVDPVRIEQVLINLVSNAIKYSPRGGRVAVEITTDDDHVSIAVSDEGIGIPPDEQSRIFEPFHRSHRSRDERIPGVGLGLAVARKIAEAHDGTLSVESTTHGSTFRLTLRRQRQQSVNAPPRLTPPWGEYVPV